MQPQSKCHPLHLSQCRLERSMAPQTRLLSARHRPITSKSKSSSQVQSTPETKISSRLSTPRRLRASKVILKMNPNRSRSLRVPCHLRRLRKITSKTSLRRSKLRMLSTTPGFASRQNTQLVLTSSSLQPAETKSRAHTLKSKSRAQSSLKWRLRAM